MRCPTEFDDSFEKHIIAVESYKSQLAAVVSGLERDAYFLPPDDEFFTEWDNDDKYFVCQHITGWNGYKLGWYFEYLYNSETTIENVVIFILPPPPGRRGDFISLSPLSPKSDSDNALTFEALPLNQSD